MDTPNESCTVRNQLVDTGHGEEVQSSGDKANPLAIPEILSHVLGFLDRPSLITCALVSRFWLSCGRSVAWQSYYIEGPYFADYFAQSEGQEVAKSLSEFSRNCYKIRSLTVNDPRRGYRVFPRRNSPTSGMKHRHHSGLKNLVHLNIDTYCSGLFSEAEHEQFYSLVGSILSMNRQIRDLEFMDFGIAPEGQRGTWLLELLRNTGVHLRRLSIACRLGATEFWIFRFLVNAYEQRLRAMDGGDGLLHGGGYLEELTLHDLLVSPDNSLLNLTGHALHSIPGHTSLRALTLIDFETSVPIPWQGTIGLQDIHIRGDTILAILRKCPLLERLRITFSLSLIDIQKPFPSAFYEVIPGRDEELGWIPERASFVAEMYKACPKLKAIDFGMKRGFTEQHWEELVTLFGPQLESLSVWDVQVFRPSLLMKLIGPPLGHPSRAANPGFYSLTELDINGVEGLYSCAWMVFKHTPTLKNFSARSVPLIASELVGYDWVCKNLETLAIFIVIPRPHPESDTWSWDNESGKWVSTPQDHADTMEREADPQEQEQGAMLKKISRDYQINAQKQICGQLGRLTKLRELTLEGSYGYQFMDRKWDCLQLTLQTGLGLLRPLQHSLEKLVVYLLDEFLCGHDEMEWMARHWVHFRNPHWRPTHELESYLLRVSEGHIKAKTRGLLSVPGPRFKELLGVKRSTENSSILEWFQKECPNVDVDTISS
ncbi:hypothetical protein BGZ58_008414 [Dissophora ornata]|nr:hypothetical protein BGZ58_008414 [Dissophora ornata]